MNHSASVFRIQFNLFRRERGMMIFYLLCIAIAGIAVPIFLHSMESTLPMAALLTVMFLKPILSDSLAGEREKKTLESLLSTGVNGKSIIWGKFQFSLLFAAGFFTMTIACTVATYRLSGYELNMAAWQWVCVALSSILNFSAISIAGIYSSATSADSCTANSKVSRIAYPFGLLLIVYLSLVFLAQPIVAFIACNALMFLYLCTIITYMVKVSKMKQADYFENVKIKKYRTSHDSYVSYTTPKSQFGIVFRHELRYLLTLKRLLVNFILLCLCPAIVLCLEKYFLGKVNLYYAVLLTALMMPRTPTNLIAYSIGGEKVYKTGESLLTTPLRVRSIFLAKSIIPILISTIMLIISSLLTLVGANIIGSVFEAGTFYMYTADQLVLLFPVGIMSCITMVFITGILSVNMKTPRQGLYLSSILGVLFVTPPLAIVYLTRNTLMWSIVYFVILLLCNAVCVKRISDRITRPQIMSRLHG
ncbi:MAG: hypothetical protein ACRDBO_21490 [Lachnospiraceae bacterium]